MSRVLLSLIFYLLLGLVQSSKVLIIFPWTCHSHNVLGSILAEELARRHHQVTYLTPFEQTSTKYRWVSTKTAAPTYNKELKSSLYNDVPRLSPLQQLKLFANIGLKITEEFFQHQNVQNLIINNETFDLVVLAHDLNDAMIAFGQIFKCPVVLVSLGPPNILNTYLFANPFSSAFIPNLLSKHSSKMSFWQRTFNVYYNLSQLLYIQWFFLPRQQAILSKYFPEIHLKKIIYETSLMLSVSHVSVHEARPLVPTIKEVGGFHISSKPKEKLSAELQDFLDNSLEGVVLFSMGSNLQSKDFDVGKLNFTVAALGKLQQNVLWKFEGDLSPLPNNIKLVKWLPQSEVLSHKNVRLFISHGGLLSTLESIYHGVPILGLPVFWDQQLNIEAASSGGYALNIPYNKLNEENFSFAIKEMLENRIYSSNVKVRSKLFKDRPMLPLQEAVFWLEHSMRHPTTLAFSQALNLKWYQLYFLDIISFAIFLLVLCIILLVLILKFLGVLIRKAKKTIKMKES